MIMENKMEITVSCRVLQGHIGVIQGLMSGLHLT